MLMKVLYWVAVVVISLALVVSLILFFESRDDSELDEGGRRGTTAALIPAIASIPPIYSIASISSVPS